MVRCTKEKCVIRGLTCLFNARTISRDVYQISEYHLDEMKFAHRNNRRIAALLHTRNPLREKGAVHHHYYTHTSRPFLWEGG